MQMVDAATVDRAIPAVHSLPELIDRYLSHCHARRLAPATIRRYRDALRVFRGNAPPSAAEIEAQLIALGSHSDWTARTAWQAWSTFFRWTSRRFGIPDPTADLAPPRIHQADRRIFTLEEIRKLFDAARSPRDKALILLALDSGARVGEIAALRLADIGRTFNGITDLTLNSGLGDMPGCEHCRIERSKRAPGGKSGRSRKVPILESTAALLRAIAGDDYHIWWTELEGKDARNRAVYGLAAEGLGATAIARQLEHLGYGRISETMVRDLLLRRPSVKESRPMTRDGIREAFKRLVDRAGITGPKMGPHTLRHVFATSYLVRGGQLAMLQRILGHQNPATTMIYTHLVIDDLRKHHATMSPVLQLGRIGQLINPRDWRKTRSSWNGVKPFVLARDGRRCAKCGATEDLSLDHVFPRSAGGKNTPGNGAVLCVPCNRAKGAAVAV